MRETSEACRMVQSSLARHLIDPWTNWLIKALSRSSR